ncbi:HupE/UreJ family protein [Vibrio sp.]|uniref:HupE/UreJ family protein n=1 Tax=Vibrio sp. TaxID=678 RepID=UPI003D1348F7
MTTSTLKRFTWLPLALSLAAAPSAVWAHTGQHLASFSTGLLHPLTGVDHLLMLVAFGMLVGFSSLKAKGKAGLMVAALAVLFAGLVAGRSLGAMAPIELLILVSLLVVSGALWSAFSASKQWQNLSLTVCTAMLFFHGYAHGVEITGTVTSFSTGMLVSATGLMAVGLAAHRIVASQWLAAIVSSLTAAYLLTA